MACKINVPLLSGTSIPALGYGTWQAKDEELEVAVDKALEVGYRHIDTAWVYENEHVIGKVLKKWLDSGKIKREELFITTKLPIYGNRPSDVEKYLLESLKKLQLEYVDLYLIHAPIGYFKKGDNFKDWELDCSTDLVAIWKTMEKYVDNGKIKALGVSNFNIKQVKKILENARILPVTNQFEHHAYFQQPELVKFLKENKITVTAYSPLGTRGSGAIFEKRGLNLEVPNLLEDPVIVELAKKYNKTPAQILLRHIVQRGLIAIPKSTNPERMKQNIDIFDFELSDADLQAINGLDRNSRILNFSEIFIGCDKHPEYPFSEK